MTDAGKKIVLCVSQDSVHTLVEALATLLRESDNTKVFFFVRVCVRVCSSLCVCVCAVQMKSACAQLIAAFCAGTQCSFESQLNLIMLGAF